FLPCYRWNYRIYSNPYYSNLKNKRNMINISAHQLETELKGKAVKIECDENLSCKQYDSYLQAISEIISELEELNGVKNLLTSNKIWELFLANYLGHQVNSHQGGDNGSYDASVNEKIFEYKIINFYRYPSWCFEDLSDNVFKRLESMDAIVVARVNKRRFNVWECYALNPKRTVALLKRKLEQKKYEYALKNKRLNRHNIHLSKKELEDNNLIINKNVLF
ncbi:MAG: hypothetical protein K2O52_01630, partial [Oscillospiraceae bacterium]|nr:hypothetical protein [Oscillospiraceae bacterium]